MENSRVNLSSANSSHILANSLLDFMNESVKIPTNDVESKILSSLVFIDESGYCSWKGNLAQLKSFVQNDLKLIGKWSSPGGETKLFKNTEIILKWAWQTRKKLIIEKDSEVNLVENTLKSLCNANGDVVCLDTATTRGNFILDQSALLFTFLP
jgi:hypothetical protein